MLAINSRQKGAAGEREFAKWLNDTFGLNARRGQQFSGLSGNADVVDGIAGTHPEIKRVERLNIHNAIDQAVRDCADNTVPYVAHRRNRKPWLITIRAEDLILFMDKIQLAKKVKEISNGND